MSFLGLVTSCNDLSLLFELQAHIYESHLIVKYWLANQSQTWMSLESFCPKTVIESRIQHPLIFASYKKRNLCMFLRGESVFEINCFDNTFQLKHLLWGCLNLDVSCKSTRVLQVVEIYPLSVAARILTLRARIALVWLAEWEQISTSLVIVLWEVYLLEQDIRRLLESIDLSKYSISSMGANRVWAHESREWLFLIENRLIILASLSDGNFLIE